MIFSLERAKEAALHHYSKSFRGFSAMLTPEQAQRVAERNGVVSVFESRTNKLHTTHTWDFLGIDSIQQYKNHQKDSSSDVIVGVIDTGVWPESESFSDEGLGPVPEKFKGECETGEQFELSNCNRKIIGARYHYKGFEAEIGPLESQGGTFFRSARDSDGHGSHTASTIAGSVVENVSLFGMARGTARGGAPGARLAIYKACWFNFCSDADVLLAMDDAISDGVDILSLSLGPNPPQSIYFEDAVSIGAFHAFHKGILVSCSAGNSFFPGTASNVAPWILTVAASSVDRIFNSNVYLGNSRVLKGFSLNPLKMDASYGLVAGSAAAAKGVSPNNASFCKNNTLDATLINGKIVVCTIEAITDDRKAKSIFIRQGGGVGIILIDPLAKDVGFQFVLPGTLIGQEEAIQLQEYMKTEKNPTSSVAAPATVLDNTKHLIGRQPFGNETTPFDYGSGHVNPTAALEPGLIYDYDSTDLINFLCSIGANPAQLKNLTDQLTYCQKPFVPSYDLNYPSIGVSNMNGSLSVHRTVTYYGEDPTVYDAYIDHPVGVKVRVTPSKLCFTKAGEKITFRVDFMPYKRSNGSFVFGALTWSNGLHKVRSPIGVNVLSV
ncbi:hypothetical protein V6N12_064642 [Hibiscus sabdariffa]|uniref:Subtilisin-like protease SBT5.3 n=1 Tax=Hibiscus sabdariffa TaxID=183260 RepID=A0ABR2G6M1_9ROSI